MFTARFQAWVRLRAERLAGWLRTLPVTPDLLTTIGVSVAFVAAALAATGQLLVAGLVLGFGGLFDILDGALARATNSSRPFGAFLDSTTDRYAEAAIYIGIAAYFLDHPGPLMKWQVLGAMGAVVGSLLVSYVRARAQSLGFACNGGLFARPERVVATVAGLLLGAGVLTWVIWALALLTNLTALQRFHEVWTQTLGTPTGAGVAEAAKPQGATFPIRPAVVAAGRDPLPPGT